LAVQDLSTAINIGCEEPSVIADMHYNRGCILTDDLGEHEQAIADFVTAQRLNPSLPDVSEGLERAKAKLRST